jgi:hypothetical protein
VREYFLRRLSTLDGMPSAAMRRKPEVGMRNDADPVQQLSHRVASGTPRLLHQLEFPLGTYLQRLCPRLRSIVVLPAPPLLHKVQPRPATDERWRKRVPTRRFIKHVLRTRVAAAQALEAFLAELEQGGHRVNARPWLVEAAPYGETCLINLRVGTRFLFSVFSTSSLTS